MKIKPLVVILCSLLFYQTPLFAKTFYVTDKVLVGVYELASTNSTLLKALPTGTPIEVLETSGEFSKIRSPDGTTGWVETSYLIDKKPAQLVVLDLTDKQKQLSEQLSLAQAELEATQKQLANATSNNKNKTSEDNAKLKKDLTALQKQSAKLKKELSAIKKQLKNKSQQHAATVKQNKELQQTIIALRKTQKQKPPASKTPEPAPDVPTTKNGQQLATLKAENKRMKETLDQVRTVLNLPAVNTEAEKEEGVTLKLLWLVLGSVIFILSGFIAGIKWLDWRNLKRHGGFRI